MISEPYQSRNKHFALNVEFAEKIFKMITQLETGSSKQERIQRMISNCECVLRAIYQELDSPLNAQGRDWCQRALASINKALSEVEHELN